MKGVDKVFEWIIIIAGAILLGFLLYWRFVLATTRFFDVDEFAHLHWSYSFFTGEKPYRDFFYLFPPLFLLPFTVIFSFLGRSVGSVIASRIFIYGVLAATTLVLFLWANKLRGKSAAILTACTFLFLPIPSDKMIEVRPDLLAVLLAMIGLYLFVLSEESARSSYLYFDGAKTAPFRTRIIQAPLSIPLRKTQALTRGASFFSGLFLSFSLVFVPKTLFFLVPVVFILLYELWLGFSTNKIKNFIKKYLPFFYGMSIPFIFVLIFIIFIGKPTLAIYSMTKMANDVTRALSSRFFMLPNLFFYPNDTYYGFGGISVPLVTNLIIYWLAIPFSLWRLLSSLSYQDKKKCIREFVFALSFWANLYAFIKIFPMKHLQYLVPVAPFIAFYFADFWVSLFNRIKAKFKFGAIALMVKFGQLAFTLALLLFMYKLTERTFNVKKQWTNQRELGNLSQILKTIPANEPIFDLTGGTVFYKNGYYFCCLPYGQYEAALSFNIPSIEREFKERKTRYIHTGEYGRLSILPVIQAKYIRENSRFVFPDGSLLMMK